jgi:hypothetical protein
MGAGQSIPATLTRQKVFELTRNTRALMNVLMDYMLKEVSVRDFLALSNPTECKKYVIFMANTLHKYFYELQIVPTKDKRGIIAFRPVKDLVNPSQETDSSERQSLCLTLAYFYTRIFQIYGALALTLIDDATYMSESGLVSYYSDSSKQGLLPPGFRQYTTMSGGDYRQMQSDLGNFYFLNSALELTPESYGYRFLYQGAGDSAGEVYITATKLARNASYRPVVQVEGTEIKPQTGEFVIGYRGARKYAQLELTAKREIGSSTIDFEMRKLKYYKKDSSEPQFTEVPSEIIPQKKLKIIGIDAVGRERKVYSIVGTDDSIQDYFSRIFTKLLPYVKRLIEGDYTGVSATSAVDTSETGTAEELRLFRTLRNLQQTKPLGHCLARAMQLLRNFPLQPGEPGVSYICKARFLEHTITSPSGSKIEVSRSGIPAPGDPLEKSPGLAATAQLFYDTILIGTPKIVMGDKPLPGGKPSSTQQYISFMKKLAQLFGDYKVVGVPKSDEALKASGLRGIRNRRDKELCEGTTGNINIPRTTATSVYGVVNQLYRTQVEHAGKCGQIFKMLFNIEQDKSSGRYRISLSENIIKKGFPEIERINYLARDVLVNYYSNCESTYLKGVKIVLDSRPKPAAAAPPAPPGAPSPLGRAASGPTRVSAPGVPFPAQRTAPPRI